ncbi:MAG: lipopolysaccharide heptosyltransferase II [Verrucomicrobiota bacterium]|nr:lipopolysaccharide heptosyltransferase II [Verrucomicrobiota bacterium]
MKFIVRMPNWIGDLVMATPVLIDLRNAFPNASITAMCRRPICDLLEKEEAIDELFCFEKMSGFIRREDRDIIGKLRTGQYDVGILLTNSFSSAWWFWQGNVKRRIGFKGHFRSLLLTDRLDKPAKGMEHEVSTYKRLLRSLEIDRSNTAPRLVVTKEEVKIARELLHQQGYHEKKKLVGINPGASYGSAKCWLPERFQTLAQKLVEEGAQVVFFGDSSLESLVKQICHGLPKQVINLAGMTNVRELLALIQECDVLVTNDSGPMHMAAALKTPLVALFGSTDDEATGPYGDEEAVINKRVSCSPCFKRTCPIDFRCMKEISVEEVLQKVRGKLGV